MRVALVHDWLTGMRGGEKVLSLLCREFPSADLLTLLHRPGSCDERIERMRIRTSVLDDLPGVARYYRHLLGLMPLAIERMDAREYDLVISLSHCVAKGVPHGPRTAHLCYCFTPMRYAWAQADSYAGQMGPARWALRALRPYLRAWDRRSAAHVDRFLANSRNVARRIAATYRRDAHVVHSPIDTGFFTPEGRRSGDFYLMVTALAPYKRADQAVEAFRQLGRPLRIIGSGQMLPRLRRTAPGNVELLGWQSDETVRDHLRRCRALIFPGEEDFGLVPLEAMACGAPVIAYGAGGALETVRDVDNPSCAPPTGLLYTPQTSEALIDAVRRFEDIGHRFQPDALADWARRFGPGPFVSAVRGHVQAVLAAKGMEAPW